MAGITQNGALKRDDNDAPVMGGTSSSDNATIINSSFDPVTRRLLTDSAGGLGTVTSVSVVSANGFAGTVATATTTPAITLTTTITGLLKGNGTAISAATAGTDYVTASSTNTFTNKTYDTAGSGNAFAINGTSITAVAGTGAVVLANTPTLITPNIGAATGTSLAVTGLLATQTGVTLEETGAGTDIITLQAPASIAASYTLTLPVDDGAASELLSTNGSGVLSWVAAPAASLVVGSTTIASGTTTRILYDNAGVLGEYTISGTGNVAMTTDGVFTTPNLGTPSALVGTNITGTAAGLSIGGTAAIATTVTVADETTDASSFIGFYTAATGNLGGKTNANMTFNSATGVATFGQTVVASISGNAATATTSTTATTATNVTVADEATDTSSFITFVTAATGNLGVKSNANMTFNSNTGVATFASTVLTTTDINGGTVDGAVIGGASAAAGTFTLATAEGFAPTATTATGNRMYLPAANTLGWAINGTGEMQLTATALSPVADGGNSLGTTALGWQNLFGNTGFVLNIENSDWVATHTAGILTVGTGDLRVTTAGTNSASVVTVAGNQTLTTKTLTAPTITTATFSGANVLGENASIQLDPAGSADGKFSGLTIVGTAGATLAFGDLIYLAVASSKWLLADADAAATAGGVMMGMATAASTDTNPIVVLLLGQIRADAKFPALTIGAAVYVGETAGAIQVAIPTGADNVIRVVGFALTADEIYFNPSQDHQITVA